VQAPRRPASGLRGSAQQQQRRPPRRLPADLRLTDSEAPFGHPGLRDPASGCPAPAEVLSALPPCSSGYLVTGLKEYQRIIFSFSVSNVEDANTPPL